MTADNIDQLQQAYYQDEWARIKLSDKPGKSGWRTLIPAPDFVEFIAYLKSNRIKGKVLDLGCGGGRHSMLLAKEGFGVYGIDFANSAISTAKANADKNNLRIDFRAGDALDLPYDDSFFDVINDDGCLHHIEPTQWPRYLRNVARVLKANGTLRIKAFSKNCNYYEENAPQELSSQWVHLKDSGYTYFFAEQDLRSLFAEHFEIVKLEEKAHTQTTDKKFFFVILKKRD